MRKSLPGLSFFAALLASATASAQNLREVPLGGRTANMGGAGVAAGYDAALPLLNPAGIAGAPYDVLSVSGSIYSVLRGTIPDYFLPNGLSPRYSDAVVGEQRYSKKHLVVMPSAISYFKRFGGEEDPGKHVLALSVLAPSFGQEDASGTFRASGAVHRIGSDFLGEARYRQILAGPTYAMHLADRFRLGASAFVSYSDLVTDTHTFTFATEPAASGGGSGLVTTNERQLLDASSFALAFVAGAQVRVVDDFWVGAAGEIGGIPVYGTGTLKRVRDDAGIEAAGGTQTALRVLDDGKLRHTRLTRPARLSAGAAYDREHVLAVAADVHWVPGNQVFRSWTVENETTRLATGEPFSQTESRLHYRRETRSTINVSVGAEVWISRTISLQGGIATDRDVAEVRTPGDDRKNGRVDWTIINAGIGHALGRLGTTYGIAYRHGDALAYTKDTFGPGNGADVEVPYTVRSLMLVLSGSVRTDEEKKDKPKIPTP
jgi:hypothetical protein